MRIIGMVNKCFSLALDYFCSSSCREKGLERQFRRKCKGFVQNHLQFDNFTFINRNLFLIVSLLWQRNADRIREGVNVHSGLIHLLVLYLSYKACLQGSSPCCNVFRRVTSIPFCGIVICMLKATCFVKEDLKLVSCRASCRAL